MVYSRAAAKRFTTPFILLTRRLPTGKPFCKPPYRWQIKATSSKRGLFIGVFSIVVMPFDMVKGKSCGSLSCLRFVNGLIDNRVAYWYPEIPKPTCKTADYSDGQAKIASSEANSAAVTA